MFKRGFTLAEILIALAIVGVIAAITLPTFVSGSSNKANAAKLATCVNNLETAFANMILKEDVNDLTETDWFTSRSINDIEEHFKISRTANDYPGARTLAGVAVAVPADNNNTYLAKSGAYVFIHGREIYIDVNGTDNPNIVGRDIFGYAFSDDGHLYPIGSEQEHRIVGNSNRDAVWGVTNRLVENNYKMDY